MKYEKVVVAIMLVLFGMIGSQHSAHAAENSAPQTVDQVDLKRYTGLWYEIARLPNRFQKQCARGTTAQYAIRGDGQIEVTNRCATNDGSISIAQGVARVVDTQSNAKLEVSFVQLLGRHFFWGDYWVIGLDKDYEYALIGHPDRKYGWILARKPQLSPEQLEEVHATLREQGYDPDEFLTTRQSG